MVPRLKDIYEVVAPAGCVSHIRSGEEVVLDIAGRQRDVLRSLLLAIDGHKDVPTLVRCLGDAADEATVRAALAFLMEQGIVTDDAEPRTPVPATLQGQAAYMSHFLGDSGKAIEELSQARCCVIGEGEAVRTLADDLLAHGLERTHPDILAAPDGEPDAERLKAVVSADVAVVVTETFWPALGRRVNRACLDARVPVLFVDLSCGNHGIVGPLCVPGQTSCYACGEARLLANISSYRQRADYEIFCHARQGTERRFGTLRALDRMVLSLAVVELLSFLTGYRAARTIDGALIVDFAESEIVHEPVLKLPGCEACGQVLPLSAGDQGQGP